MTQLRRKAAGARGCVPATMEWTPVAELTPPLPDRQPEDQEE